MDSNRLEQNSSQKPPDKQVYYEHHGPKPIYILLGALILALLLIITGYFIFNNLAQPKKTNPPSLIKITPTVGPSPTPTIFPTPNVKTQSIDTSKWKTYNDTVLDISFKYPSNWIVNAGDYIGSVSHSTQNDFCPYIKDFLKNPSACNDNIFKSQYPGLNILPPKPKNASQYFKDRLQFVGPTSGLGGACVECSVVKTNVLIDSKSYLITIYSIPGDPNILQPIIPYSTFEPLELNIPTGQKSVWSKFDLFLEASDSVTFSTEVAILQSITVNK